MNLSLRPCCGVAAGAAFVAVHEVDTQCAGIVNRLAQVGGRLLIAITARSGGELVLLRTRSEHIVIG